MNAKKLTSLLLCVVIAAASLLSACRRYPLLPFSRYLRAETDFSELEYSRPDFDAIIAMTESIDEMAANKEDEDDVYDAFEELDDAVIAAFTADDLLSFKQSIDTTDEYISTEIDEIAEPLALCKQAYFRLAAKLLDSEYCDTLFADYTEEEKQEIRDEAAANDDEYVALSKRQTELQNKYKSNLTLETEIEGKTMTLAEVMEEYGEATYYMELNKVCTPIYIELIDVNKQMAAKRGYDSFADYAYKDSYGRDFTPKDADKLSKLVEEYFIPLYFDLAYNLEGYENDDEFDIFDHEDVLRNYFASIDSRMVDAYDYMKEFHLYVIDDKEVMQQGAYTTYLTAYDVPLIFIHTDGSYRDLGTFIHEFGHFYAFYLYGSDLGYDIDIDEIHSQGDEVLSLPIYKELFGESAYKKFSAESVMTYLENTITACIIDHYEQLAYSSELTGYEDANALFAQSYKDFGLVTNSTFIWTMINHLFEVPMYYISYSTSLIPTLELYATSLENYDKAVELYNEIIAYSVDAEGFCDLAEHTGISDPFAESTIKTIAEKIKNNFAD